MSLTCCVVGLGLVTTDPDCLAAVAHVGRYKSDGAVAAQILVAVHECHLLGAGLFLAAVGQSGAIRLWVVAFDFHGASPGQLWPVGKLS